MKTDTFQLDCQQQQAINHGQGPCIVYAGPGSGKTSVIVQRILALTQRKRVPGRQILVVTFTKAAAEEMKERYLKLLTQTKTGQGREVTFGTFHALFYRILKQYQGNALGRILREEERAQLLRNILKAMEIPQAQDPDFVAELLLEIGKYHSVLPEEVHQVSQLLEPEQFLQLLEAYDTYKQQWRLMDFDDMLVRCYRLLIDNPQIKARLQERFQYILVDEFQDINPLQFRIVQLLCGPGKNLFVVGDDDQAIYGFRGGTPELILAFSQHFEQAAEVYLQRNYRSQGQIVTAANRLIQNNEERVEKEMEATRQETGKVQCLRPADRSEETQRICELIEAALEEGLSHEEIAVLFRVSHRAFPLAKELLNRNIPFYCKDLIPNLFDHWIGRDLLAYLKISMMEDLEALALVLNKPVRYLPKKYLDELGSQRKFLGLKFHPDLMPYQLENLKQLALDLKVIRDLKPLYAIRYIRTHMGYDRYLEQDCRDRQVSSLGLFELLDELEAQAEEAVDHVSLFQSIRESGEAFQRARQAKGEGVNLMTMHGAKGLEFQRVIIIGATEGLLPHTKSLATIKSLEEERRLFYVAVTRAKDRLFILAPQKSREQEMPLSRFVGEMGILND